MKFSSVVLLTSLILSGCHAVPTMLGKPAESPLAFKLLSGDAALEPAFVRVTLVDKTRRTGYGTQALPASWNSATVRLHPKDGKLTADRTATLNRADRFGGGTSSSAVFTHLRPGNYTFQVVLFTDADAGGTSAAVHTVDIELNGGTNTAITVTMKTTDGTGANGGTTLNTTVDDASGSIRATGTNYNSVESVSGYPVIVSGDTLILDPQLADSTANGGATVTTGSSTASVTAGLDPGVLSRVVVSYVKASVTPNSAMLHADEKYLTDWVRAGSEPISGQSWQTLANGTDGNTWPAGSAVTRTGGGTFSGTYNWNTTNGVTFVDPTPFANESALSENYRLVYRYFDNTYKHNLITIRTLPLAVVAPASIDLTVN